MYSSKGTTLYQDGVEIAYLRAYDTLNRDKYQFVAQVADALNNILLADRLANALTDLVGLVKAPDKNLQYYASQVRSALAEADRTLDDKRLFDYNLAGRQVEQDRKDLDMVTLSNDAPLDADDVALGALAFDASLVENGLAATLSAPTIKLDATVPPGKSAIIREAALKLGLDVVEIPTTGGIPMAPEVSDGYVDPTTLKRDKWDTVIVLPNISRVQRDAIIAGLRLLQQEITGDRHWRPIDIIDEIAGDSGTVIAAEDIDGLCEAFNIG